MKTRPLCIGCGVFSIVLFFLLTFFPVRSYNVTTLEDSQYQFCGYVTSIRYRNDTYQVFVKNTSRADSANGIKGVLAYLNNGEKLPHIGALVCVKGRVSDFLDARNEGQFSLKDYYRIRGIDCSLKNASIISESRRYNYLFHTLYLGKNKLCKVLKLILPKEDAAIMEAMLLGNKDELDSKTQNLYQRAGISHVLAISGLHISLIGMALYEILKRFFGVGLLTSFTTGVFLVLYGMLCSDASSTLRAIIMFIVMVAGDGMGRAYDMYTALSIAGVMGLIANPLLIYDSGFLMSYSAVISIGMFNTPLRMVVSNRKMRKFSDMLMMTISVSILTIPVTLYFFFQYPLYSIFLNLIVIPLMTFLVAFGFLSLIAGCISIKMGTVIAFVCRAILFIYKKLCLMGSEIQSGILTPGKPDLYKLFLYYILIFISYFLIRNKKTKQFLVVIFFALLIIFQRRVSGFELTVLDVSQGSCSFVRTKDCAVLFDGGSSDVKDIGKYRIAPFLKSRGVDVLDGVFISHMDADHTNGIKELFVDENIKIQSIFLTGNSIDSVEGKELIRWCEEEKIKVREIETDDELKIGDLSINCLYPDGKMRGEANELSAVFLLKYKKFSLLLPGDLEGDIPQKEVIKKLGRVNCYVVAHHGSKGSSSEEFLQKIRPDISLISAGINNSYGHPHKELLDRLSQIKSKDYLTSRDGAITVKSDGEKYRVSTFLK